MLSTPRPELAGDLDHDVAMIGGGLTGLWTAWYLLDRDPRLRIAVLEKEIGGFRRVRTQRRMVQRAVSAVGRVARARATGGMRLSRCGAPWSRPSTRWGGSRVSRPGNRLRARAVPLASRAREVQLAAAPAEVAEAPQYGVDGLELLGPRGEGARARSG